MPSLLPPVYLGEMKAERTLNVATRIDRREDFEVIVLCTETRQTLLALKTAAILTNGLHAHIRLLAPQIVPYPLPLEEPPISEAFLQRRLRTLIDRSAIAARIDIRLCRDRWQMLNDVLAPGSVIVLHRRRRWLLSPESRLAKKLQAAGHRVVFSTDKE